MELRERPWLFQPGQSGNPSGRPKASFAVVLRAELEKQRNGLTNREAIARKAVEMARQGNLEAMKWVADRVDGKIPDRLETDVGYTVSLDPALRLEILAYAAGRAAERRALDRGA